MSKKIPFLMGFLLAIFLLPLCSQAQNLIVGRIINKADQSPIPGATVAIKGTHIGTSTAVDGTFGIKAKQGDVLVISGIGVVTTEEPVSGNNLNIVVPTTAREMDQVVVTATGIKKDVKRVAYAVQTIDASTMTQARESNPVNSLKGEAAGLQINTNQEVGHAPDVIMRGENDMNDRPMFVIDGVPIESDTYNLNPDDIETFTVLKGPNAAALYGFQGKNGAIIVTTKKGTKDKRGFSIQLNTSQQMNKGFVTLPKYQDEYGPGEYGEYAFGGGGSSTSSYFGNGVIGNGKNDYDYDIWGPKFNKQLLPQYDGTYTPNQTYVTTFPNGDTWTGNVVPTPWTARGKDNLKKFIQTGLLSTNSLSISSSTEKTDFRVSVGDVYQRGIIPNTEMNNANLTTSLVHRFNNNWSVTSYFNYSRQFTPNVPDVDYGPNSEIYNIIIWGGADWAMKDMRNYWQPGYVGVEQKYEEYYRYNNPYFMAYEWLRGHYQNNEYGYVQLNYKVNQQLDFQFRPSMTTYDMQNTEKMPYSAGVYDRPLRQGDYREDKRSQFESNWDLQARFHQNNIANALDLSAVAGATVRTFSFNSSYETTNYLTVPGIYNFNNSLNPLQGTSYDASMLVLSAYYSVDLGYKSFVTLNVTGREDKSSSMPSNTNGYFYPSFNLATVVSDYVNLPHVISFLKLKASYAESKSGGTTPQFATNLANVPAANDYGYTWYTPYGGPTYQFSPVYTLQPTYSSQVSAQYTDQLINPTIVASDRKAYEFGGDIRFINNRIGLDVTHYHYKNTGIVSAGTSPGSGYSSYLTNGNVYTNDGWEAVVTGKPIVNPKGWSWTVTANFFTYIRKWVKNSNPDNWEFNGRRIDLNYGDGFVRAPDGKIVVDPSNGLPIDYTSYGSSAEKIYGHSDPDWQWSLINQISYKSFSFRFQFDGMVGGVIQDYVRTKTFQGGRHSETASGALGVARPNDALGIPSYVAPGVNLEGGAMALDPVNGSVTNMKSLTEVPNTSKSLVQDYIEQTHGIPDLDFIKKTYAKLRELTLTYQMPRHWFGGDKSFVQNATVSLVGRNLLYFFPSKYKDLDVDQYSQNTVTNGGYANSSSSALQTPTTRNFGFNLNFTF
jgi:TonB-linked SusC/RagA family outer membrane protein